MFRSFYSQIRDFISPGEISIIHQFHRPPYGGGNQFLLALMNEWIANGITVSRGHVGTNTRALLMNSYNFDFSRVRKLKRKGLRIVHRVDGPISVYRGSSDSAVDRSIAAINAEVADATIFQSRFSMQKHLEMDLQFREPIVIYNACNKKYFHPASETRSRERPWRIVGTAWSDNVKKGLGIYQWLDENLDHSRFSVTFVGRTKGEFRNIRVVEAMPSLELGEFLRTQDVYLAPSEDDPCSNALVEALACGLPAIFRDSGGHPELVGKAGLPFNKAEDILGLLENLTANYEGFRQQIQAPDMEKVAQQYLKCLLPEIVSN